MNKDSIKIFEDDTISIYQLLLVLKKRIVLISIVALAVPCMVSLYILLTPNVYKVSNMLIVNPNFLNFDNSNDNNKDIENDQKVLSVLDIKPSIDVLETLSRNQQKELLKVSDEIINALIDIRVNIIKETNSLRISFDTLDGNQGVKLMNALQSYLNNLPIIQKILSLRIELLAKNKIDLEKIIADSFEGVKLDGEEVVADGLPSLYSIKEKYNRVESSIKELEKREVLLFVDATYSPEKPYKPNKVFLILAGIFIGVFSGYFLGMFMEWLQIVKQYKDTQ